MRVATTKATDVYTAIRLDSKFFLDEGQVAYLRVIKGKWPMVTVGDVFGKRNIWMPPRITRVIAASAEHGKPLLVPYDCFRYLPWSRDYLSKSQVKDYASTEVQRGWLLIVRSGRNLGPVAMVDKYLERFTVSDDMIRISLPGTDELLYFTALMSTKIGQALIRRDRNGSVIDHLGPKQVAALQYPVVNATLKTKCIDAFRAGLDLREQARLAIEKVMGEFLEHVGLTPQQLALKTGNEARRFSISRKVLADRFDSEPYAPLYRTYRDRIMAGGSATSVSDLADVVLLGRKKTLYVADETYGVKVLNGRQIAQCKTIAVQSVSSKAWDDMNDYLLTKDMVLVTCDGRAEENLADCVLVRDDREGMAANWHIVRLKAKQNVHPGLLYLACACGPIQQIFKSLARGSVIDGLTAQDISLLKLPFPRDAKANKLGDDAVNAWNLFAKASKAERAAIAELETEFMGDLATPN